MRARAWLFARRLEDGDEDNNLNIVMATFYGSKKNRTWGEGIIAHRPIPPVIPNYIPPSISGAIGSSSMHVAIQLLL